MDKQRLFIISGPSGAGEDSVINGLAKRLPLQKAVTTTTREKRDGEVHGVDYYFVTKEEFKELLARDLLAEWAQQYNDQYYGVTKKELARIQEGDSIGVWKIDYKGVEHARKMFPHIIAIFLMAESLEILEKRIRERSHVTEEYVRDRMAYTREWLGHTDLYDYTVVNKDGQLENTIDDIERLVRYHADMEKSVDHVDVEK